MASGRGSTGSRPGSSPTPGGPTGRGTSGTGENLRGRDAQRAASVKQQAKFEAVTTGASKLQRRRSQLQLARGRRKAINAARIQRAELLTSGIASGGGGQSSVVKGAISSVGTDTANVVAEAQEELAFGLSIAAFNKAADKAIRKKQERSNRRSQNVGLAVGVATAFI